jgi:serine/threonine-protein kinase
MFTGTSCPLADTWREMLESDLSEPVAAEMMNHLNACERCQQTVEELTRVAGSWPGQTAEDAGPGSGPGLRRVMDELKDPQPEPAPAPAPPASSEFPFLGPPARAGHLGRLGGYEVLSILGRGGMGVVFKGFDRSLSRFVAIKVLAPQLAANAAARQRFGREGRAAAAVSHEHVVAIYQVEEAGGWPYLVMEYVPGESLQQRLDRSGPLQTKEVLRIGVQAARGLAAAHAQGVVHRDVKPANILLENGLERIKLTDFGLARSAADATVTASGTMLGTPQFMSPEQAQGRALDVRSDLFSLGSVLYALCTGKPPFRGSTPLSIIRKVCDEDPHDVQAINPDVPDDLAELIETLHEKDPADRYQSAEEVAEVLGEMLAGGPAPRRARRPRRRPQTTAAGGKPRGSSFGWVLGGFLVAAFGLLVLGCGGLMMFPLVGLYVLRSSAPPFPPQPGAPREVRLTDGERAQAIRDLRSDKWNERQNAVRVLAQAAPDGSRKEVAAGLKPLLKDQDHFTRVEALKALKNWGDDETVDVLLPLVDDPDLQFRREVITFLGDLKDARAAEPLTKRLGDWTDRDLASQALKKIGQPAEKAVAACLKDKDANVRREACKILRVIGTRDSLPALRELAAETDRVVGPDAQDAIRTISAQP